MQKFNKNDLVRSASDSIGKGTMCIVLGSYNDLYPGFGGGGGGYSIFREGKGEYAWADDGDLELVERNRPDILEKFRSDLDALARKLSDLDWIFLNGDEVLEKNYGASIQSLATCFGLTNLWGSSGEGIVWQDNAMKTMAFAYPFLLVGDKDGWLKFCDALKKRLGAQ